MSDTEEPVLSELNQILKLQEAIKTEYHGIVDGYSQGDGLHAENQAVLNNLVVRFLEGQKMMRQMKKMGRGKFPALR